MIAPTIYQKLEALGKQRPLFHSEADFQHALAWSVHQDVPDSVIRLERPFRMEQGSIYLDLFIRESSGRKLAIELKYKTRKELVFHEEEEFRLKNQGAQDLARYDFLWDVSRLEGLIDRGEADLGYAIFLTNDPTYWTESRREESIDAQFRLHEGRRVTGTLAWQGQPKPGTIKNRELPIALRGAYLSAWRNYSKTEQSEFRFLAWTVGQA
ncbi:MAG: hypothetical protein ABL896_11345 [Hylemonella sp.]